MIEVALNTIVYTFLFLLIFLETLMAITFFEKRKEIRNNAEKKTLSYYPLITLIVPCWNEENTIEKTIESALESDYPKDKLEIIVVDDGSTDKTWEKIGKFQSNPQVKALRKDNGGKHTALNLGIENSRGELVGCLDADTYIDKDAVYHMALAFTDDKKLMGASATIILKKSESLLDKLQKADFYFAAIWWKAFSYFDAVYIIPGQFSVFRKKVFESIGLYKKGHSTEDMEMTMRMRSENMKIRSVHLAKAYTSGKPDMRALYKQRLRWTYGGLKNIMDYKHMLFNKKYGILGLFVLPFVLLSMYTLIINLVMFLFYIAKNVYGGIVYINTVGLQFATLKFDIFYLNPSFKMLLVVLVLATGFIVLSQGMLISENRFKFSRGLVYYVLFFWPLSAIWVLGAVVRAPFSKESSWR